MELPTTKHVPSNNLSDYVLLIAGEKKVGKTSICNQFPNAYTIECEPGNADHLECFKTDVGTWNQFEQIVTLLEKNPNQYSTVIIDEIPNLFRYCTAAVLKELAVDSLGDAGWGKGWDTLRLKFSTAMSRLLCLPFGVIFTAHTVVKEFTDRSGNKRDRLEINASKMLNEFLDGCVNTWLVFLFNQNSERYAICQGDSFVKAFVGLEGRFRTTDGHLLKNFPLGESPQEGYQNLLRASNNGYDSIGSENYEPPVIPAKTNNTGLAGRQNTASGGTMQPKPSASKFIK